MGCISEGRGRSQSFVIFFTSVLLNAICEGLIFTGITLIFTGAPMVPYITDRFNLSTASFSPVDAPRPPPGIAGL
jgi:hypothetical protein